MTNQELYPQSGDLATVDFYKQDNWFYELCEILFKVKHRGSSVSMEIYYGFIHFVSCLYILAVVPQQLAKARYEVTSTVVAICLCCGIGSIIGEEAPSIVAYYVFGCNIDMWITNTEPGIIDLKHFSVKLCACIIVAMLEFSSFVKT